MVFFGANDAAVPLKHFSEAGQAVPLEEFKENLKKIALYLKVLHMLNHLLMPYSLWPVTINSLFLFLFSWSTFSSFIEAELWNPFSSTDATFLYTLWICSSVSCFYVFPSNLIAVCGALTHTFKSYDQSLSDKTRVILTTAPPIHEEMRDKHCRYTTTFRIISSEGW